jgi:hypothetical protein
LIGHCLYNVLIRERSKLNYSQNAAFLASKLAQKGGVVFDKKLKLAELKFKVRSRLSDILDR